MLLQHHLKPMPRGGRREGSGSKPSWKHGKTKPVRVPEALAERILEIARILDEQGDPSSVSKVVDLTGVAVLQSRNGPVVRLADLIRVGYTIKPERLIKSFQGQIKQKSDIEDLLDGALQDE
jgi:hypothetical protein